MFCDVPASGKSAADISVFICDDAPRRASNNGSASGIRDVMYGDAPRGGDRDVTVGSCPPPPPEEQLQSSPDTSKLSSRRNFTVDSPNAPEFFEKYS
jgi:hypothetical protein